METEASPTRSDRRLEEGQHRWSGKTIAHAFDEAVARTPDKTMLVAGDIRWTYAEVAERADAVTRNLARLGVGRGDVISVQLLNCAEFALIYLAATRLGAVTNPLLPIYRAKELSYILSFAKTKVAFIPDVIRNFDYPVLYRELKSDLPDLEHICVVGADCPDDMMPFDSLLDPTGGEVVAPSQPNGDDVTVLIFTSGTESTPKGVLHTHDTLMFGNVTGAELLKLTCDEVIWAVSPIGHATGLEWTLRQAIVLGATVVMQDVWDVEKALALIEREGCTFTTAATTFAAMLLDAPSLASRDLSSFRTFLCGGAAIPSTLGAAMRERVGCNLIPCWGMSECFAATMCRVDDPEAKRWGTDGRAMPGSEVAIFDETRTRQLAPGEVGEIATRGPHVSLGYFNDPERTADTFSPEGWLFSNDLGVLDEQGYLRVVGRKKDIINRGGLKISASEVEEMLIRHPAVRAAALVGVPDAKLGERSCACIVAAPGATVSLPDLVDMLKGQGVSNYKLPEYIALIDELPTTPTGKVQKFKLREDLVSGAMPMTGS